MAMSPETLARRTAARKRERVLAKLTPIASRVEIVDYAKEQVQFNYNGAIISGHVDSVNQVLEQMGFRPVRLTRNMLNDAAPGRCIDINTPSYCDEGSEAYWSM